MDEKVKKKGWNKGHDNLIPIKKGEVRNPTGRPKGQRDYATIYREALIKLGELNGKTTDELENELIASGFVQAKKDFRFYKDIQDRLHGTPVNRNELTGKDGKDLLHSSVNDLTNDQLEKLITERSSI